MRCRCFRALTAAMVALAAATAVVATTKETPRTAPPAPEAGRPADLFGALPALFVENRGQTDPGVAFYARGRGLDVILTEEGIAYRIGEPGRRWVVRSDFAGAARVRPEGVTPAGTVISHFRGPRSEWRTGLPTWREVRYRGLWAGIDLSLAFEGSVLKSAWHVAPGADPSAIRAEWRGATLSVGADGSLVIGTPFGSVRDAAPRAWQTGGADVAARWHLAGTACGFALGPVDPALPLVVDPAVLVYSGCVGGGGAEYGQGIAVDGSGCAYIVGRGYDTAPPPFPVLVGPDLTYAGSGDAFIAKVNAAGTGLVYAGFIGGTGGDDWPAAVAVDGAGCAYVAGHVHDPTGFPAVVGPDLTHNGGDDAYIAKVSADGSSLVYCGFIGGAGEDWGHAVAVDDAGAAYVGGWTDSFAVTFPEVGGPDLTHNGMFDGFVAKVAPDGSGLQKAGYIGGSSGDGVNAIAVNRATGEVWVAGQTASTDFPVLVGPDLTFNGPTFDAFVGKLKADFSTFEYLGYLGGAGDDKAYGIAVDCSNYAHVVGATESNESTFPVTAGPDLTYNGNRDAFVAKLHENGAALYYAGYIGGSDYDEALGVATTPDCLSWITGWTGYGGNGFPCGGGPDSTHNGSDRDAFLARPTWSGDRLLSSGYFGSGGQDTAYAIATDASGDAYVAGFVSIDEDGIPFPVLVGPDLHPDGATDAFVAKFTAPDHLAVTLKKGALKATDKDLGDSVKVSGAIQRPGPWELDPETMAARVVVGGEGDPYAIDIPPGDPGWKWGKGKYSWKGPGGALKLDLVKGTFQVSVAKVDLPAGQANPIVVRLEIEDMEWLDSRAWTESTKAPGNFKYP